MSEDYYSLAAKLSYVDSRPSILSLVRPLTGPLTYLGVRTRGGRVPVYSFFDHTCRSIRYPLKIAVTTARDWRGGQHTYDKHLGTDFVVPVGTPVVAAARGVVMNVGHEDIGGPFVWVDHGGGYATSYHHLSHALVRVGQQVSRGELIAVSGASGAAIAGFFPLVPPHLHFGLHVDGVAADPFPGPDSPGFWADGSDPRPYDIERSLDLDLPYEWLERADLMAMLAADPLLHSNITPAMELIAPPRLSYGGDWRNLVDRPRLQLNLPFRAEDVSGIAYP